MNFFPEPHGHFSFLPTFLSDLLSINSSSPFSFVFFSSEETTIFRFNRNLIKSLFIFDNNPFIIDTIISELYLNPNNFNEITLRTPFFLKLEQSEIRFILSYLNYTFIPKNNNDPIFGNDAYFFGVNINLDNLFSFKESNFKN